MSKVSKCVTVLMLHFLKTTLFTWTQLISQMCGPSPQIVFHPYPSTVECLVDYLSLLTMSQIRTKARITRGPPWCNGWHCCQEFSGSILMMPQPSLTRNLIECNFSWFLCPRDGFTLSNVNHKDTSHSEVRADIFWPTTVTGCLKWQMCSESVWGSEI